jgi:sugar O-acyltransferase (sialic acid O-acetyltransferase NeuD family)
MERVVLFGEGELGRLAHFYLTQDSPYEVAAFTVDGTHMRATNVQGLPVVPFEEVQTIYPPGDFKMFIAVGYAQMNKLRESKYHAAKELGYDLVTYLSSTATVWPGTSIGDNCFIMEQTVIQPLVTIGNDVVMWSGCHINHESEIQDHCFLSSDVVVAGLTTIEPNCFLGLHATIRNEITVARECVIGAGSLIMKDTQPREVYAGHRAQLLRIPSDRLPATALTGHVEAKES